jgi:hypothetical protein
MVNALRVLFSAVFVFMSYKVIDTSLKSNLFSEWDYLAGIRWMRATLWDFYANVLVLSVWVCYKESKLWAKALWIIALALLGSIGTCAYVLVQLFRMKSTDSLDKLFAKQA